MVVRSDDLKKVSFKMSNYARKITLNDEIYEVTERTYRKVMGDFRLPKKISVSKDWWEKRHERRCEIVRKEGKKVGELDLMLRDD